MGLLGAIFALPTALGRHGEEDLKEENLRIYFSLMIISSFSDFPRDKDNLRRI